MDATQAISDSFLESDEEENEEERRPLAKLCVLKNEHIPETELPLFLGENVLGRDSNSCTLPLPAPSVSKQHATICITVYRRRGFHNEEEIEALVWDLGSMNGTRKGRMKLTPNVRYALSERDSLVVADIPCQYVSCAVDTVSSQGDSRTLESRNSGVKARLPDALGEEGGDTSTGSKTCVNGGTEALPELEDTTKTPVRTGCLSFAPTPTQPEGTLVPESDVDSDGERERGADRKLQTLVSDSDSRKSSPSCSSFLSPTNKTIPESEDESPITPSSAKNRSHKHVSFSMDETDVDVGRQQLKEKKALVIADDSEEEEDREEERAALKSEEGGQHVPVKQERNVGLTGEDELPVSRPALLTDAIPAFNMDSDTDVEGEEEGVASAGPVTLQTDQQADQPPDTAQFHMDSDTDVDEDDGALDKVTKPVPFPADNAKPPHVISVIQPEAITMDSDTDVDDDAAVSDAASKLRPVSFQSAHTADSAPSTQLKDFHLDSDTDVDDEEEKECGAMNTSSKIDETPSRLDIEPIGPESAPAAHPSLHSDSDTDDEGIPAPAVSEPSAVSAVAESGTAADKRADWDILSDSDTDVEADSPLVVPFVVTTLSFAPDVTSEALQSGSDADTDVDESSVPPAGDAVNPANLNVSSNTNVEDEVDFGGPGEGQIPSLCRESTPGMLSPPLQNCSTPVQSSGGQVEDMDTQAFVVPSSGPFRCSVAPAERLKALSSCSESQEEDDFALDETQSFVLQTNAPEGRTKDSTHTFGLESSGDEQGEQSTRGGSFQLGLSDSSHLQGQAQALAMESTQAFVSVDRGVNLEDTQAYAAILNAEITSLENDSHLEATQAYGEDEEPARGSVMSEKESQVELALQATQAYISEPCSNSEDETDEKETKDTASAETQPLDFPTSSTLAMAETQLMSAFEEEESVSTVLQVKPRPQSETEEKEEHREATHPQSVAETQPMLANDDEESDDEDLILGPRKRKAKLLHLEEEQMQPLTSCETQPMHIGVDETQPMATSGNEDSDEDGSILGPRKSKAKQLCIEEEQTQMLTNSELSAAGTQPMDPGKDGESDEEDSIPGPRKRKAKPLQLEDEQTQLLTSSEISTAETQPIGTCDDEQSDEEDSFPGPQKRKAKPLKPEEEQTQSLTISQVSAAETQPMVTGEDGESSEEDSTPGPRKRKAKPLQIQEEETQPLTNSETSTVETQQVETKADLQLERERSEAVTSGVTVRGKRGTRAQLREEEEQAACSEPPKRQTRGKNKVLPTTRGRRGKLRPDEDESEEEEEVEQAKRTRGKKNTRQQKDDQEENLERERKEKEEKERVQAENAERLRLEQETAEKETIEKERKAREEKERADRIQKEKEQLDRERKEKEERERLEREKVEREEKERLEREQKARIEKERKEQEEKERLETAKKELEERLEREAKEKEERERLEKEKQEKEAKQKQMKEQQERLEREAKEREERERLEKEKQEKEAKQKQMKEQQERLEREAKEREERERLEKEKQEKEAKEKQMKEQQEKLEREAKERAEREILEKERQEKEAKEKQMKEQQERLEREAKEREERETLEKERREKEAKEKQMKEQQENKPEAPARGRRAARRTTATTELKQEEQDDDAPARRTRSRSNSSNSVSSERSAASVNTQESSRGRGRGKGAKKTSEPPQAAIARSSNRRRTVAAGPTEDDSNIPPQGVLSRSNSSNSLNSEISSCSLSSQSGRGRGGRQRGRGRKTEAHSIPPYNSQSAENSAPKPTARGRKSRKAEESSNVVPHEDDKEKAVSQQATTTRGRQRANANDSKPATADEEDPSNQDEGCTSEESLPPKRNVRGRGQKAVKSETVEAAPAVSDGGEAKEKRKGRKRELEASTEEDASSSSKIPKGKEKAQGETKEEIPAQANRRGRATTSHAKDSPTEVEMKGESEKMEEEAVERRGRGRVSAVQKKKKEEQEESETSVDQDAHAEASEPQTPTSRASRKRQAPPDSSDAPKTPRSSSASPAAKCRLRPASQTYKVLFTGVVDEEGERVLTHLGGGIAKGVADMNFLVTDKVRRTLKFLCAVAKGVPIVTTQWLEKSGKAGSFLSPNAFVVKDAEQEKKFNFCLQDSLRIASSQPLLQGYEIHVTKSVKPEPDQMKDIITCSGATFLSKMPSSHKPQTVVISCEEDWSLCAPALSASLPVVTAEFILTGVLQQKVDFQTHLLSAPTSTSQPAGGRGRGRKKT